MKGSGYFMLVRLDRQDGDRQKLFKIENFRILPSFGKHNKKWATAWKLRQV